MSSISLHGRNSSVLVVDDEPGMRTALEANFQRHGWRWKLRPALAMPRACWSTQASIW